MRPSSTSLTTAIRLVGQTYLDEPLYLQPIPETQLGAELRGLFGRQAARPLLDGFERVKLRWMKPGPDGKLVPR